MTEILNKVTEGATMKVGEHVLTIVIVVGKKLILILFPALIVKRRNGKGEKNLGD